MTTAKTTKEKETALKIAVILVRGLADRSRDILRTLELLSLRRKNQCVVLNNTPSNKGMVVKVKDFVTWGELSDETFHELVKRRGEILLRVSDRNKKYNYKTLSVNGKAYKTYFRLNPPQKGFGRNGLKVAYKAGGALGYRGEKINDLIKRML